MKLRTPLISTGGNTAGIKLDPNFVESLGKGKRPPVKITVNGHSWRSTVAVMGGEYWLGVAMEHRAAAGVKAGQEIEADIELDTAPREVEVPEDFAAALDEAGLRSAFDKLAPSHRKEHVRSINEAKAAETRQRRIEKAVEMLKS
jgi:hypothetical protein